jgi:hypothetical protein
VPERARQKLPEVEIKIKTEPAGAKLRLNGWMYGITTASGLPITWKRGTVITLEKSGCLPEVLNLRDPPNRSEILVKLKDLSKSGFSPARSHLSEHKSDLRADAIINLEKEPSEVNAITEGNQKEGMTNKGFARKYWSTWLPLTVLLVILSAVYLPFWFSVLLLSVAATFFVIELTSVILKGVP